MRSAAPRRRGFSPDLFLNALAEIKGSGLKALLRKAGRTHGMYSPVFRFNQPWARLEDRRQSRAAWAGLKALLRKTGPNAGLPVGGASAPIFSSEDASNNKGSGLKALLRMTGAGA